MRVQVPPRAPRNYHLAYDNIRLQCGYYDSVIYISQGSLIGRAVDIKSMSNIDDTFWILSIA